MGHDKQTNSRLFEIFSNHCQFNLFIRLKVAHDLRNTNQLYQMIITFILGVFEINLVSALFVDFQQVIYSTHSSSNFQKAKKKC